VEDPHDMLSTLAPVLYSTEKRSVFTSDGITNAPFALPVQSARQSA
jgi:hypothetical protein